MLEVGTENVLASYGVDTLLVFIQYNHIRVKLLQERAKKRAREHHGYYKASDCTLTFFAAMMIDRMFTHVVTIVT